LSTAPQDSRSAEPWRFELTVWPHTPTTPWHAEVRTAGHVLPLCFEHPTELLVYLTRLTGSVPPARGLR
jgi:hypothetical protein